MLLSKIEMPNLKAQVGSLGVTASVQQCIDELVRLGQRLRPSCDLVFPKSPDQSFVAYLREIRLRAAATGSKLGKKYLVTRLMGQVKSETHRHLLIMYEDDPDTLADKADELEAAAQRYDAEARAESSGPAVNVMAASEDEEEAAATVDAMRRWKKQQWQQWQQVDDRRHCFCCGRMGHIARFCPDRRWSARPDRGRREQMRVVCTQVGATAAGSIRPAEERQQRAVDAGVPAQGLAV